MKNESQECESVEPEDFICTKSLTFLMLKSLLEFEKL